jgi:hypothetical protein
MLRLTAPLITLALAFSSTAALAQPRWEVVGKTNADETLSLDINSIKFITYEGNVEFAYRLKGRTTTREIRGAFTPSCDGSRVGSNAIWYVPNPQAPDTPREIIADSPGSRAMLNRVCQINSQHVY